MYPDPVMQEVTHFCLPGLLPILKNTVQFVHEVQHTHTCTHTHTCMQAQSTTVQMWVTFTCHTGFISDWFSLCFAVFGDWFSLCSGVWVL